MSDIFTEIILDPRNEQQFISEAQARIYKDSKGTINTFLTGDPSNVLISTQAYTNAELLFYASQLPLAFALKFLEFCGATSSVGSKATTTLTFELVSTRDTNFVIPANFEVNANFKGKTYSFFTIENLTIAPGNLTGSVDAIAKEVGIDYRVPRGSINKITRPLSFLKSCTNLQNVQNGSDPTSNTEIISEAIEALRRRSAIAELDYEEFAQKILGTGSRAKAIGLLAANKISTEKGAVHLFCLSPNGNPSTTSEINAVKSSLLPYQQLGTKLYVSPMEVLNLNIDVIAKMTENSDPNVVGDDLYTVAQEFYDPTQTQIGGSVDPYDLSHALRFSSGIEYIEDVKINGEDLRIPLANDYTIPLVYSLNITLVDQNNVSYTLLRGTGELV